MKEVTIYTDGACRGNGKEDCVSAFAYILIYKEHIKEYSKGFIGKTNNEMELKAVVEALGCLNQKCKVNIFSDSAYVVNGATKWVKNWVKNNWIKSDKKPVANKVLWQDLIYLMEKHDVTFTWVKGHSDNKWNNKVDKLCNEEMDLIE